MINQGTSLPSVSLPSIGSPPPVLEKHCNNQTQIKMYLQHQDEVFRRFIALEQEVLLCSLVFLIKFELLDHTGVFDQPQQDLL